MVLLLLGLTLEPASPGGPGFPASPGSPYKEVSYEDKNKEMVFSICNNAFVMAIII